MTWHFYLWKINLNIFMPELFNYSNFFMEFCIQNIPSQRYPPSMDLGDFKTKKVSLFIPNYSIMIC